MAVIKVRDGQIWGGASWLYRFILERMKFPASHIELTQRIDWALVPGYNGMSVADWTDDERELFRLQVVKVLHNLIAAGPDSVASHVVFHEMVRLITQLDRMLQGIDAPDPAQTSPPVSAKPRRASAALRILRAILRVEH